MMHQTGESKLPTLWSLVTGRTAKKNRDSIEKLRSEAKEVLRRHGIDGSDRTL